MKARIKETGEIIDLAQEVIGHKGERFQWFQLELIPEPYDEFFDWQSFHNQAAKDILCAILSGGIASCTTGFMEEKGNIVKSSIKIANELIKQLKEKEE